MYYGAKYSIIYLDVKKFGANKMLKKIIVLTIVTVVLFFGSTSIEAAALNENRIYTDTDSKTKFTVPEGWSQKEFYEDREYIDVKFCSDKDPTKAIVYGSTDLWNEVPSSEKTGLSRSDVNNSMFSDSDIATMFGSSVSTIKKYTHNGKEYFGGVFNQTQEVQGVSVNISVICRMYCENGWVYIFQFSGEENDTYYNDFISLINSVNYPLTESSSKEQYSFDTASKSSGIISLDEEGEIAVDFIGLIFSFIFTVSLYSVPVAIYRFGIRRRSMERKHAIIFTVVYAVVAFIIMSLTISLLGGQATGGGIWLWSAVNFYMLTKKSVEERNAAKPASQTVAQCTSCGYKDDYFKVCPICGNKGKIYLRSGTNRYEEAQEETKRDSEIALVEEPNKSLEKDFQVNSDTTVFAENVKTVTESKPTVSVRQIVEKDLAPATITITTDNSIKKAKFCRKCGARLYEDSEFCHKCGTRTI